MEKQEHNSDYFISMTDMMVGVLFVFIIIVSYFVLELQKTIDNNEVVPKSQYDEVVQTNVELRDEIERLRTEVERLKRNSWERYAVAANSKRNEIIESISEMLAKQGIKVDIDFEIGVIRLEGDGLFNRNSSDLSERREALKLIDQLSNALYQNIECYGIHRVDGELELPSDFASCNPDHVFIEAVYVEGHSDSDAFRVALKDGSRNNLELSARRATNTYAQMAEFTPALTSIVNPLGQQALSTAAYGAQRPIRDNTSNANKAANRRIDLRFVMYLPKDESARAELQAKVERLQ